jgi:hypothetical protein
MWSAVTEKSPRIDGAEKAAIVMLACGPEHATRLLNRRELDEIKEVAKRGGCWRPRPMTGPQLPWRAG